MRIVKRGALILILVCASLILYSCDKGTGDKPKDINIQEVNNGAIIENDSGTLSNLELSGQAYKRIDQKETVVFYNKEAKTSIFVKDGKHFIDYKGKQTQIEDSKYNYLKFSKNGEYLAYMVDNDGYELKVINLKENKNIEIKSNVVISGGLFDFINNDIIVYYGIDNKDENGVFTYNLETGKEELLYKVEGGYVEYLKCIDGEVLIFQQTLENNKVLKSINVKTKKVEVLDKNIDTLFQIEKVNGIYYMLGSTNDDGNSLYSIENGKTKRLIYDFPKEVLVEKGLSTENGNVLFIGKDSLGKNMDVYSYKDGDTRLLTDKSSEYSFVKVN